MHEDDVSIPAPDYDYPHLKNPIDRQGLPFARPFEFIQGYFFGILNASQPISGDCFLPHLFDLTDTRADSGAETWTDLEDESGPDAASDLAALFRSFFPAAASGRWRLPRNVYFLPGTLENLNHDAPVARWSRGFIHSQLLWQPADRQIPRGRPTGAATDALRFFGNPDEQLRTTAPSRRDKVRRYLGIHYRACFPDALVEAGYGRCVRGLPN